MHVDTFKSNDNIYPLQDDTFPTPFGREVVVLFDSSFFLFSGLDCPQKRYILVLSRSYDKPRENDPVPEVNEWQLLKAVSG